jgi:hypothetical protein
METEKVYYYYFIITAVGALHEIILINKIKIIKA